MQDITEQIIMDKEQIKNIQGSSNYLKIVKYADNMTYENMVSALIAFENEEFTKKMNVPIYQNVTMPYDTLQSAHPWPTPCCDFFYLSNKPFIFDLQYYGFSDGKGISSKQSVIKKINDNKMFKLINGWQKKIHTIKGVNYDAITNVSVSLLNYHEPFELILKVNNNILCSRMTVSDHKISNYEFIKFPNFILNDQKDQKSQKIEIFIRSANNINLNSKFSCDIEYDIILFDNITRTNIFTFCKTYMFETSTGIICVGSNGMYGPKYNSQLINSVDNNFKYLYNVDNVAIEDEIINNELNENIKICI